MHPRYAPALFALILSGSMSLMVSGIATGLVLVGDLIGEGGR